MKHLQNNRKHQLLRMVRLNMIGILALAGLVVMVPLAFSYLSSTQEQGIAIRAASASEIWEIEGAFDVNVWKSDNSSGISIHNKSPRDLWIFFEYTGDLKQVFKQSGPVQVKAGETCPVILPALDDKDSPRVPNPLDLIVFQSGKSGSSIGGNGMPLPTYGWQWKNFTGTLKIHTLNCYADLEAPVQVSGSVLWDIYFARNCGMTADDFCSRYTTESEVHAMTAAATIMKSSTSTRSGSSPKSILQASRDYLTQLRSFQPLEFIPPVQAAVEKLAPGLWKERQDERIQLDSGAEIIRELIELMEALIQEKDWLQEQVDDQQYTIEQLQSQLDQMQDRDASAENSGASSDEGDATADEIPDDQGRDHSSDVEPAQDPPEAAVDSALSSQTTAADSDGSV